MTILLASKPHASHVTSGANTASSAWSGLVIPNSPDDAVSSPPLDVTSDEPISVVATAELDSTSVELTGSSEDVGVGAVVVVGVVELAGGAGGVTGVTGGGVITGGGFEGVVGEEVVGAAGGADDVGAVVVDAVVVGVVLAPSVCPQADASNARAPTQPSKGRCTKERWSEVNCMGMSPLEQ